MKPLTYVTIASDNLPYEKVGKAVPVCIADEVPFEIPDSWEWVRLGSISNYDGKKQKVNAQAADPEIWGLDLEDIEKGGRIISIKKVGERKAVGDKTCFQKGDILYSKLRPYLLKILVAPDNGICTSEIVPFKIFGGISAEYMVYFLKSPYVDFLINSITYGVKMPRVGTDTMVNLLVSLPPIAEQKRIVKKIQEVQPTIDKYGELETASTSLDASFPDQLKKSILQQAVQGKLVPQDPSDEPASVLLERIRAEKERLIKEGKIKRDKHESVIFRRDNSHYEKLDGIEHCIDDEISFEIPESWEWVRLSGIANLQTGTTPSTSHPEYFGKGIPFIKPADITPCGIDYNNESLTSTGADKSRRIPTKSVMMVCIGGSIGKCYYTEKETCCNQQINAASPFGVDCKYLWVVLSSDYIQKWVRNSSGGTATPIMNKSLWGEMLIPVPPVNEQIRIVKEIARLMPYIEQL